MKSLGILLLFALSVLPLAADEGMWLFNQFPKDQVRNYNFDVTDQFLDNLRLATLRIRANSGSMVSANGLILTDIGAVDDCVRSSVPLSTIT